MHLRIYRYGHSTKAQNGVRCRHSRSLVSRSALAYTTGLVTRSAYATMETSIITSLRFPAGNDTTIRLTDLLRRPVHFTSATYTPHIVDVSEDVSCLRLLTNKEMHLSQHAKALLTPVRWCADRESNPCQLSNRDTHATI